MQHADTEYLGEVEEELQAVLAAIPLENRLRGVSAEEVLRQFTPQEILGQFTPQELLDALSEDQAARFLELLERKKTDG